MTAKVNRKGEIIVPWSVLRRAGFKAGDWFSITARPGVITIRKVPAPRSAPKTKKK